VSCKAPSRAEIQAHIFLNNSPLPQEICDREPELRNYGLYRRLNDGKFEFLSFCSVEANKYLSMHETEYQKLLEKYVPQGKILINVNNTNIKTSTE